MNCNLTTVYIKRKDDIILKMFKKAAALCCGLTLSFTGVSLLPAEAVTAPVHASVVLATLDAEAINNFDMAAQNLGYSDAHAFMESRLVARSSNSSSVIQYCNQMVDLNNDGACDASDALIIQQFLVGDYKYDGHTSNGVHYGDLLDLDIDGDYVVDSKDSEIYLQFYADILAGFITNFTPVNHANYSQSEQDDASHFYETRYYKRYNFQGTTLRSTQSYGINWTNALSPSSVSRSSEPQRAANAAQPPSGFTADTDSRIVHLIGSDGFDGTGFIIGAHTIATAAHTLLTNQKNVKSVNVKLFINGNYSNPTIIHPTSTHVPQGYLNATSSDEEAYYDYGMIVVSEDLSAYGKFNLGVTATEFLGTTASMALSGFPYFAQGEGTNADTLNGRLFKCTGNLMPFASTDGLIRNYELRTNIPNRGGQSGSPMYMNRSSADRQTVVAVLNTGVNTVSYGDRMLPSLLRFYFKNPTFSGN